MSPASTSVLLGALLEDFSQVTRPNSKISGRRPHTPSPAVACRAVKADTYRDLDRAPVSAKPDTVPDPATPVLIHGAAPAALAAWKSAMAADKASDEQLDDDRLRRARIYGIDIVRGLGRRGAEAAHSSLGMLAELPRAVPVSVGLTLGDGWRDTMALIRARGRGVRFHVNSDSPGQRRMADAIRAAVAEGCAFSWSCGHWQPVTEPPQDTDPVAEAGSLPGILNILLATAQAVRGADSGAVAAELGRTDTVDVVDAVQELSPLIARRVRRLLRGFAVYRIAPAVDALTDLGLLPKIVTPMALTP
ncbi:MAG TPA: hypothetical protein VGZ32_09875 [Actinocrinis sp.]|jgi:hypothetical protein|uniref:hypothetical protein n=1 Tax=Actinocrinis sp. TaxID=1920516 RepID=UPI002DDD505D|nr:hypothetical protein [Actinocrinis sp.]HEV3170639.1 hypothetical protein [Actinocrinis sp.]